jgi:hypothetical protein
VHDADAMAPYGGLLEQESVVRLATFVGREAELAALRRVFAAEGPRVVYLHGPGGVGKTSLLHAFAGEMRARGAPVACLDARDFEATREGVARAVDAVGFGVDGPRPTRRALLVLDTYELLAPLEPLLIRDLLRRVDDDTLLLLGTRRPPTADWRALSLWGRSVTAMPLRNLSAAESAAYLVARGIDEAASASIAAFAHGHPLALAIATDAWAQIASPEFSADHEIGVITALYDYFTRGVEDPIQKTCLEIAAIMPALDEAILVDLAGPSAVGCFHWLRGLCFIDSGSRGLYPHDLAREVILAEVRWRNTERLTNLVHRALRHAAVSVEACSPEEFPRAFADFAFVLSHNPRARVLMVLPETGLRLDELRPADAAEIEAAVERHEGPLEAERARHWLTRQPSAFTVARREDGKIAGFIVMIRLDLASDTDRRADPRTEQAWEHATVAMGAAPQRPAAYCRWFMSCDHHQRSDPAMALCSQAVGPLFFLREFQVLYVRIHGWEDWRETARLCAAELVPALAHESAGKAFLVTVQDQRGLSGVRWMTRFCERTALADWRLTEPPTIVDSSLSALSREDFRARLREALRALRDPLILARNPLVHCQMIQRSVAPRASGDERAEALRELLCAQIKGLGGSPRGDAWRRAMTAAYVDLSGKHEAVALELSMSYSTFRRLLGAATEHIADSLWEAELG